MNEVMNDCTLCGKIHHPLEFYEMKLKLKALMKQQNRAVRIRISIEWMLASTSSIMPLPQCQPRKQN